MAAALKFLDANGLRFGYLERGNPGDPLVVLLHGFPDTPHTWDATMGALADAGYRAVAPFTRAYYPTEIPKVEDYRTETLAADALAIIDALRGKEQSVILVGHDFGAGAAYSAAGLAPEKIRLLVTLAIPHPKSITPTPRLAWTVRHFYTLSRKNSAKKVEKNDFAHIDELVKRWSPAWDVPKGETDKIKEVFRQPGHLQAILGYYRAITLKLPPSQRKPVSVPAIAFAGEHDIIAPRAYEKARHCFTASYEVVQMPGGHFMHREHPAHFTNELVRALRDHDKRS